jgi:hypothetical protein
VDIPGCVPCVLVLAPALGHLAAGDVQTFLQNTMVLLLVCALIDY